MEKFYKIFHNNLVGMILTDKQQLITDINDHLLQLLELERKDVIGKTGIELGLLNEEFIHKMQQKVSETGIGSLSGIELSFSTKSKKNISVLFSTEPIEINNREQWLSTIIDISERKKAEKELADVYARVTDGFVAFDENWNYTYLNNNAGIMMQRDPAQMIGKNVWVEFPHLVGSDIQKAYYQAMEKQEVVSLEMYFPPEDMWYLHMIYPSPDACSVFFKDINFRKKDEKKIEESELRFRTLTKTAPVGIFETDATGSTTYVNETWLQYSGMKFEEAMGDGWLDAVHPEDREWVIKGWHSKTEISAESYSEYRIVDKNGKLRWVSGKAVPVINAGGEIAGYIGIILDFTERREAEINLKESSQQLRELSRHLQEVREEERLHIAREIHDELGQQLTGIKMDIAWLKKKFLQDDPVVINKFDDIIFLVDETVKSIRRITTELRPSIIDDLGLNAAIEWHITDFSNRMGIEISYQNNFDDVNINPGISIGLFRILQESLTNIVKHARADNVVIKIERVDDRVRLSVRDNGVGFNTSAKQDYLTFGLLGIKERASKMQGDCFIVSKPGAGTTIEVSIPLL